MSDFSADTLPLGGHLGRTIGKFKLERRLGSGAMGDVFLGVHVALGSAVAIKILNARATAEPTGVERFLNEARAVAAIGHENIASVIDQDVLPDGTPYIVMEYVEGTTLRDLLTTRGALPLRFSAQLAIDVLSALGAAHAKGIVHRDLKPENVRVTPNERAKVLDFGVAKLLHSPSPSLSTDGAIIGTPHYMAPEQVAAKPLDGRADVYSVGVMLFECVTGRRPFEGENLIELLQRQVHAAPPWPHQLRADIPPALEEIILKALEKDPSRRFDSAEHMAMELRVLSPSLDTAEPPAVSGRSDERATPGAYTPTRRAVATPDAAAELPTQKQQRALPLTVLFVALVTVSAGVTYAVQQSKVIEVMPRPTPVPPTPVPTPSTPPVVVEQKTVAPAQEEAKPAAVVAKPAPVRVASANVAAKPVAPAVASASGAAEPPSRVAMPGVTMISTGSKSESRPIDFDPKHFEMLGYMSRAKALAAARMSDAVLIDMSTEGVYADGHADLTLSREFEANYWFRSPSRSKVNPVLPERDQEIGCKVYVTVSAKEVEVRDVTSSDGCREKALPPLRCTMEQAMDRARAAGAKPNRVGKVSYLSDGTWMYDQGDGSGETAYFSCP